MKVVSTLLYGFLGLIGLIVAGGFFLGWQSQTLPVTGLVAGQMRACPDTPNCVSSQADAGDESHAVSPISGADWQAFRQAIVATGGRVVQDDGRYLHATFTSKVFRFVDDVEALRDDAEGVIHIRSASRVGHSDLGANRKRVEAIRALLKP